MQYKIATTNDLTRIMEIIRQAQAQMKARGTAQWQNGYPAPENIDQDIAHGWGIVACDERSGRIAAYAAVIFGDEPAYTQIDGAWLSDAPYVVVHRLAVAEEVKGQGVATAFMRHVEEMARIRGILSFRVDTNFDNTPMQRILATLDFTYCGEICYESGLRRAYEKRLTDEKK